MAYSLNQWNISWDAYKATVAYLSQETDVKKWDPDGRGKNKTKKELEDLVNLATGSRSLMLRSDPHMHPKAISKTGRMLDILEEKWNKVTEDYLGALRATQAVVQLYEGILPTKAMTEQLTKTRRDINRMLD